MLCGSAGSKSRLAKAAGAEPGRQMRDEKLHAAVARSTFASQKSTKHLKLGENFWKLRYQKSVRYCGAKHICKSKVSKADGFGALGSQKCQNLRMFSLILRFQLTNSTNFFDLTNLTNLTDLTHLTLLTITNSTKLS